MRVLAALAATVAVAALPLLGRVIAEPARDPAREVQWLNDHAIRIASVQPDSPDLADLEPLGKVLGKARVVVLGEPSHGDGTTFLFKTRLIRYLHQRQGFDVLAFERGLYDTRAAWKAIQSGDEPRAAFALCDAGAWSAFRQMQPLLQYLATSARGERPLELCGFDCQLTGEASDYTLYRDFGTVVRLLAERDLDAKTCVTALQAMDGMNRQRDPGAAERQSWRDAFAAVRRALDGRTAKRSLSAADRQFWRQMLTSSQVNLDVVWNSFSETDDSWNQRDAQMARNLLWQLDEVYRGRKLIVWTGSFHNARSLEGVTTLAGKPYGGTAVPDEPMARHLAKALGDRMYSLGFIAAEGEYFRRAPRGAAPIAPPEPGSLEDLCLKAKLENAWIDFAGAGADGAWLRQPLVAGPFQYQKRRADWTRVFDGLVFTRKMEAAVPLADP